MISEDLFKDAQDEAFESLEAEECTSDQCIRKIQEILQVEDLFVLQILREGEFTQLSLSKMDLDSKQNVDDICESCNIVTLVKRVEALVDKLVIGLSQRSAIVQTGTLEIKTTPPGAIILVDGALQFNQKGQPLLTPSKISLTFGKHQLRLQHPLHEEKTATLNINKKNMGTISYSLKLKSGTVTIETTPPGATVLVDGKPQVDFQGLPIVTPDKITLSFGKHQLTLRHPSFHDTIVPLNVDQLQLDPLHYSLKPKLNYYALLSLTFVRRLGNLLAKKALFPMKHGQYQIIRKLI